MSHPEIEQDLAIIARQERELHLPTFGPDVAWQLGTALRALAIQRNLPVVVDIRLFSKPYQLLFYTALVGTTPDNLRWVERKSNVVARFHRSSYAIGLELKRGNSTLAEKHALPDADYAAHGGSFPLTVQGAGTIGSFTVSGLPSRADHELVIETLCLHIGRDYQDYRLSPAV